MRIRNRTHTRSAVGIITAVATVFAMARPASAASFDAEIISGTLQANDENGEPVDVIDLGDEGGVDCGSSGTATIDGDEEAGTIEIDIEQCTCSNVAGVNYMVELRLRLTGTYTVNATTTNVGLTGSLTLVMTRATGLDPCTKLTGAGPCTIAAGNLALNGVLHNTGSMPAGGTLELTGGNSPGDVVVTGTATNCGPLIALNSGYVELPPHLEIAIT